MNKKRWCTGKEIQLNGILNYREERFEKQKSLNEKYGKTLVCFTLNIVGPVKSFLLADKTFVIGNLEINKFLKANNIPVITMEKNCNNCGYESYFVLDADPYEVKKLMRNIEDGHPLGRIFDIDVFDSHLTKISREDIGVSQRRCLLCGESAFICGSTRKHGYEELFEKEYEIMNNFIKGNLADTIGSLFVKALTYEVMTTPKPGLVDRHHNGTHTDMDIALFMESIEELAPYFKECVHIGVKTDKKEKLFEALRILGLDAEKKMFERTKGVNTHKGLIFSGGILCGAVGYQYAQNGEIKISELGKLCQDFLSELDKDYEGIEGKENKTNGELIYLKHQLKGIKGESIHGYPTVFNIGLPAFYEGMRKKNSLYSAGRIALLYLMGYSEDTNIIARSNFMVFKKIQNVIQGFVKNNPIGSYDDKTVMLILDAYFTTQNISPGGSADLLAIVYFLYFLDNYLDESF
ncbi:MAG: citrate lyase holo-[acyl-carrier protein] synthase [Eubacteriaceae bacterium]